MFDVWVIARTKNVLDQILPIALLFNFTLTNTQIYTLLFISNPNHTHIHNLLHSVYTIWLNFPSWVSVVQYNKCLFRRTYNGVSIVLLFQALLFYLSRGQSTMTNVAVVVHAESFSRQGLFFSWTVSISYFRKRF